MIRTVGMGDVGGMVATLIQRVGGRVATAAIRPYKWLVVRRRNEPAAKPLGGPDFPRLRFEMRSNLIAHLAVRPAKTTAQLRMECLAALEKVQHRGKNAAYSRIAITGHVPAASPLFDVALADDVLAILYDYFGTMPILHGIRILHSTNIGAHEDYINFHYDRQDDRSVRLFLYLNDVGPDQAPFQYLPFDVCRGLLRPKIGRVSRDWADRSGLSPWVRTVTGPAGTAFLCDVRRILHSGSILRQGERLVFSAIYTYRNAITRHSLTPDQIAHLRAHTVPGSPQAALIPPMP